MTEFVRFTSAYEHKDAKTKQRTRFPAGWTGEVEAEVAKDARKAGAVPPAADEGSKPSPELVAARKAVKDAEAREKKATNDAERIEAQNTLKAAQDALAALEA